MPAYPFTRKPEELTRFLQVLPSTSWPPGEINSDFFKKLGFSVSSSKSLLSVLKSVGFVTSKDQASDLWQSFVQEEKRGSILARAIEQTYRDLFKFTMCPYLENDGEIFGLLKKGSDASAREIRLMVETFRALSNLADFQDLLEPDGPANSTSGLVGEEQNIKVNPNLQLNIQVHIDPATPNDKIETIFKSMRKYLLGKTDS